MDDRQRVSIVVSSVYWVYVAVSTTKNLSGRLDTIPASYLNMMLSILMTSNKVDADFFFQ
jgi:hypothetical protein